LITSNDHSLLRKGKGVGKGRRGKGKGKLISILLVVFIVLQSSPGAEPSSKTSYEKVKKC
jgi:hypothetical protein